MIEPLLSLGHAVHVVSQIWSGLCGHRNDASFFGLPAAVLPAAVDRSVTSSTHAVDHQPVGHEHAATVSETASALEGSHGVPHVAACDLRGAHHHMASVAWMVRSQTWLPVKLHAALQQQQPADHHAEVPFWALPSV